MPCFYFHVHEAFGSTLHEHGRELPDLEIARREAVIGVRSILSAEIARGRLDLGSRIEVTDETGSVVLMIPFRDTVEVQHGLRPIPDEAE
jgi:hypothetical protein